MRLLFDQNLAPRLVRDLEEIYPGSTHVRNVGLERAEDAAVWEYAAGAGLAIVTKDDDFRQRSFLLGAPPKVVWLRLGNCTTAAVEKALRSRSQDLLGFADDPTAALLVISRPV